MVNTFVEAFVSAKNYVVKTLLFNQIKTGNPLIDTFLTTIFLGLFSWLINIVYDNHFDKVILNFSFDDIKGIFFKKNIIIIEGKKSTVTSSFLFTQNISTSYSNRFKAIWFHIIKNIEDNKTIYKIKESFSNCQTTVDANLTFPEKTKKQNFDLFMVNQNKHFFIDDDIYAKVVVNNETSLNNNERMDIKTDKITLYIFSYKYSMAELIKYLDNITEKYLLNLKNNRINKKFIYSLDKVPIKDDETRYSCWREDIFESSRTFDNIFFDGKKHLIDKIDFFLKNKNWYNKKGIPYTLGIGLHGVPGTGKTSFIKAMANYTNRHIIVFSLKLIKTKEELENLFFENTYNDKNEISSIGWDKKIIVFEDVDCIGDIILNRDVKLNNTNNFLDSTNNISKKINDKFEEIYEKEKEKENKVTLDDILNLWDGIRETPGRILIISSNYYDKLDQALIRPGRIDITHEFTGASHNTIAQIYFHLFEKKINNVKLQEVKENFYTPAELINIYVSNKNENEFMTRLLKNKKI